MELPVARTSEGKAVNILARLANRHGLIAGATGTGKTVTLQSLAEQFSAIGVPVFMADVKGDLAAMAAPGVATSKVAGRFAALELPEPTWKACPAVFWEIGGTKGHPVRTTISEMGPQLIARFAGFNETQTSVLQVLFKIADDGKLLLLDLKDLSALLRFASENIDKLKEQYGHISSATLGTMQRNLLALEGQGLAKLFGEPALDITDLLQIDKDGRGYVNILSAESILQTPAVYSTFLLWLLSELFESLPEVGDLEKPKLVFFFDEAHLMFQGTSKALLEKIEQMVRLIRSKGVGVYFVTQNPSDIPDTVLGQLAHRFQHALRAFTPADQKAVKTAADTMRPNPKFKTADVITQLEVGEVLISVLDASGAPTVVERAYVIPPVSRVGTLTPEERNACRAASPLGDHYEKAVDRESAFELLSKQQSEPDVTEKPEKSAAAAAPAAPSLLNEILFGSTGPRGGRRQGLIEKTATSAARSVANSVGREIMRGLLGSLTGGSRRR